MIAELVIACCFTVPDPYYNKISYEDQINNFHYSKIEHYYNPSYTKNELELYKLSEFQFSKNRIVENSKFTKWGHKAITTRNYKLHNGLVNSVDVSYSNSSPYYNFQVRSGKKKVQFYYDDKDHLKTIIKTLEAKGRTHNSMTNFFKFDDGIKTVESVLSEGTYKKISSEFESPELSINSNFHYYEEGLEVISDTSHNEIVDENTTISYLDYYPGYFRSIDKDFKVGRLNIYVKSNDLLEKLLNSNESLFPKQAHHFIITSLENNVETTYLIKCEYIVDVIDGLKSVNFSKYKLHNKQVKIFNEDGLLLEENHYSLYDDKFCINRKTVYTPRSENDIARIEEEEEQAIFNILNLSNTLQVNSMLSDENTQARIISMDGKSWTYNISPGTNNIDTSNLTSGAYLVQVMHESKPEVYKFIR